MPDIGDELYGLPPSEFIAARTALVARLKADGEREVAATVKQRRRPTAAAAELNRILRLEPSVVEDLITSAGRLRDASQRLLQGEVPALEPLRHEHRAQAELLASHAERDHARLQTALETASLDEGLHRRLRTAVFVELPTPTQGFDLLTPVTRLRDVPARPVVDPKKGEPGNTNETQHKNKTEHPPERRAKDTAKDYDEWAATLDRAKRRRAAAEQRVATSRQRVADLEARLEAAIEHLRHSETQLEATAIAQERAEGGDPTTMI